MVPAGTVGRVSRKVTLQGPPYDLQRMGGRLRLARETRGYGCNDLDKLARLSSGYTSKIETGRRKDVEAVYVLRLAQALKISIAWLITGEGTMDDATSGTLPVAPAPKPNLEHVLRVLGPKRKWGPTAIAAARALPIDDLSVGTWPKVLDDLQATLGPIAARIIAELSKR